MRNKQTRRWVGTAVVVALAICAYLSPRARAAEREMQPGARARLERARDLLENRFGPGRMTAAEHRAVALRMAALREAAQAREAQLAAQSRPTPPEHPSLALGGYRPPLPGYTVATRAPAEGAHSLVPRSPSAQEETGAPVAESEPARHRAPTAEPVSGKPGIVISPFAPEQGWVDVRGLMPGMEVRDPYTGRVFRVP